MCVGFFNISQEKHISLIFKLNRQLKAYIKGTFLDILMHSSINSKQMTHTFKLSLRQNSKESQLKFICSIDREEKGL